MKNRILITGAQGFIGSALASRISTLYKVRGSTSRFVLDKDGSIEYCQISNLHGCVDWSKALTNVDVIIHCAARAHVIKEEHSNPMPVYRVSNVEATINLARQAVKFGIKRFIFLSSIGVNGLCTTTGQVFTEKTPVNPHNEYARSKWEAEQKLFKLSMETGLEVVVIRAPLVYGKNAPGNFGSLAKIIKKRIPLPVASINNRRSLIGIDNLVDFIATCIDHPKVVNELFLISDGCDVSTAELVRIMANAVGSNRAAFSFPIVVLRFLAQIFGKLDAVDRLCDSLQVDASKANRLTGWVPPVSLEEGLKMAMS